MENQVFAKKEISYKRIIQGKFRLKIKVKHGLMVLGCNEDEVM